jgi:hypothetical protein
MEAGSQSPAAAAQMRFVLERIMRDEFDMYLRAKFRPPALEIGL